jgi:murein L,D-transpeptidase YcbB/YkuD
LEKKIRVFSGWAGNARELDPMEIDWSRMNAGNFHFKLRQNPGPINSLGRLKFIFKNESSVYLHGTPAIELFKKTHRAFSSGCIRVEKPVELVVRLLDKNVPTYPTERIMEEIEGMKTSYIKLKEPVPIHVLYWTSWVDKTGKVHFRNDIYGLDQDLYQALGYGR